MSHRAKVPSAPLRPLAVIALLAVSGCASAPPPAAAAAAEVGLWVGPLQLCRDTVEAATAAEDSIGMPSLEIRLKPELRDRLRRETEKRVGQPMAVRLDGRIVSEPFVQEPITGGEISLSGATRPQIEAMRAASSRAC